MLCLSVSLPACARCMAGLPQAALRGCGDFKTYKIGAVTQINVIKHI